MSHVAVFLFIAAVIAAAGGGPIAWALFAVAVVVELLRVGGVGLGTDADRSDIEPPLPH